jgi:uncharacterized protein (TIGR02466 family)
MVTWDSIFPTPIMRTNIGRKFSDIELRFVDTQWASAQPNLTNFRSRDTQVLEASEMHGLKAAVIEHINLFARKVISPHPKHAFYITQSWFAFTQPGQSHFRHRHANSLISGTLYIYAKKEVDGICFYRDTPAQILVSDEHCNPYNARMHRVNVDVGDLILFPSTLLHEVEPTTGGHIRVSLAFNAFVKGELGSEQRLNRLIV